MKSVDLSEYAFCEPVVAGPLAPWCIRPLTPAGKKLTGGIDTPSLCGRAKPVSEPGGNGWDIARPVVESLFDAHYENRGSRRIVCAKCVAALRLRTS